MRRSRTRLFDRLCARRSSPASSPESSPKSASRFKFPDTPLILAGALGGPFVIFFLTPLRNALTLAANDPHSTAGDLYGQTFAEGFAGGWTGGIVAVPASCPQFVVMGPFFHFVKGATGSPTAATAISAAAETLISFASQTLNAQLAQEELGGSLEVPLWSPLKPLGPGATVHISRNFVAMSGIRVFASPCQALLGRTSLPAGLSLFLGDFIASLGAAVVSAPLNQMHSFCVCSAKYYHGTFRERVDVLKGFLSDSYLAKDEDGNVVGLTPTLPRDLFMRCAYVATLFAMFGSIERIAVSVFAHVRKRRSPPP